MVSGNHSVHEAVSYKDAIAPIIGAYFRAGLFSELPIQWPLAPVHMALFVAAGFPTNRWPNARWIELTDHLTRANFLIDLVGGPGERNDLRVVSHLGTDTPSRY